MATATAYPDSETSAGAADTTHSEPGKPSGRATGPSRSTPVALGVARILLGFVFLWPFLDKALGLGFATPPDDAWIAGGSPTAGYLGSLEGTFASVFQPMAGQTWVDWSFMLGMLLVGVALLLGIALWAAAVGAVALMGMLWLTSLPLENNPAVDEHLIYAALAVVLATTRAGDRFGAGRAWSRLPLVRGNAWLA